jgi:hypothetical protein
MKLLEKLDKAILDMKNQKYGFALSALIEIRAKLTPEFEIGEKVLEKEDYADFYDATKINDVLFSMRDDHFYFNSPDWDFILPADEIEKFEVKK